jgi:hypothetical protein
VRISRRAKGKPPEHVLAFGGNHNLRGEPASVPLSMKIDKCTGAISEMTLEMDKVR